MSLIQQETEADLRRDRAKLYGNIFEQLQKDHTGKVMVPSAEPLTEELKVELNGLLRSSVTEVMVYGIGSKQYSCVSCLKAAFFKTEKAAW